MELHRHLAEIQSAAHGFWLRKSPDAAASIRPGAAFRPMLKLDDVPEAGGGDSGRDPMLSRALGNWWRRCQTPRMIVILRYQEDLEPAEIAELLEMPVPL
jgi:hypothetical protein